MCVIPQQTETFEVCDKAAIGCHLSWGSTNKCAPSPATARLTRMQCCFAFEGTCAGFVAWVKNALEAQLALDEKPRSLQPALKQPALKPHDELPYSTPNDEEQQQLRTRFSPHVPMPNGESSRRQHRPLSRFPGTTEGAPIALPCLPTAGPAPPFVRWLLGWHDASARWIPQGHVGHAHSILEPLDACVPWILVPLGAWFP